MDKEKPSLAIMIGKAKPKSEDSGPSLADVAKEILEAIKAEKSDELAESLESFITICQG